MNKEEIVELIIKTSCEIDANISLMLAMADIESEFNQHPNTCKPSRSVQGLYQLSSNIANKCGIKDRCIENENQIKCTWKFINEYKKNWNENKNGKWKHWYSYGCHQLGEPEFKWAINNLNNLINTSPNSGWYVSPNGNPPQLNRKYIPEKYWKSDININDKVSKWANGWEEIFNILIKKYSSPEYWCPLQPQPIEQWEPTIEKPEQLDKLKVAPTPEQQRQKWLAAGITEGYINTHTEKENEEYYQLRQEFPQELKFPECPPGMLPYHPPRNKPEPTEKKLQIGTYPLVKLYIPIDVT